MPDDTPAFLVAVAFDGTLVRPARGGAANAPMPGADDFLAWLPANRFALSLWTARTDAALDTAVDWLAGRGTPESDWASIGIDHPAGQPFGAAVTVAAPGFPMLRVSGRLLAPDWDRVRADLLTRRAWRDGGADGGEPAAYLSPDNVPVPKAPRCRTRPPAAVVAARAEAAAAEGVGAALPANLDAAIAETALGPRSVTVDGQTVQTHDLSDLIEADRYLASKKAAGRAHRALQTTQMAHSGPR